MCIAIRRNVRITIINDRFSLGSIPKHRNMQTTHVLSWRVHISHQFVAGEKHMRTSRRVHILRILPSAVFQYMRFMPCPTYVMGAADGLAHSMTIPEFTTLLELNGSNAGVRFNYNGSRDCKIYNCSLQTRPLFFYFRL